MLLVASDCLGDWATMEPKKATRHRELTIAFPEIRLSSPFPSKKARGSKKDTGNQYERAKSLCRAFGVQVPSILPSYPHFRFPNFSGTWSQPTCHCLPNPLAFLPPPATSLRSLCPAIVIKPSKSALPRKHKSSKKIRQPYLKNSDLGPGMRKRRKSTPTICDQFLGWI